MGVSGTASRLSHLTPPHHYPTSPLSHLTTIPPHYCPTSPLSQITTIPNHHYPKSPLSHLTTIPPHHYPTSPTSPLCGLHQTNEFWLVGLSYDTGQSTPWFGWGYLSFNHHYGWPILPINPLGLIILVCVNNRKLLGCTKEAPPKTSNH